MAKKGKFVEECLEKRDGPIIAASDYVRSFADQIRPYLSKPFYSFGTDGYGRSDGRIMFPVPQRTEAFGASDVVDGKL